MVETMSKKGQSAVEYLVLLSAGLLMLLFVFALAADSITGMQKTVDSSQARTAVSLLATSAKEVYSQGAGARENVYIQLPSAYDPNRSFVANKTIYLQVGESGYAESLDFDVRGKLPSNSGYQYVMVISEGSAVRIGNTSFFVSKSSLPLSVITGGNITAQFFVENVGNAPLSFSADLVWPHSASSVSFYPSSFTLAPYANQSITVTYSATPQAHGIYGGLLTINSVSSSEQYPVLLSLDVGPSS